MNPSPPVEIARQLAKACAALERNFAGTLQAIHLFGSAVDGGLKPDSDIDLLATVGTTLTKPVRRSLMMDLLSVSALPGNSGSDRPLEVTVVLRDEVVPWRYPPLRELQFGEWLRDELEAGCIQPAILDPDLAVLLTQVRRNSVTLIGGPASELFDPVPRNDLAKAFSDALAQWNVEADWQGDERNVVLTLARIWFSVATGGIAPKDVAAAWALERLPEMHRPVLAGARASYLGISGDNLAENGMQVAAWIRYVKETIGKIGVPT